MFTKAVAEEVVESKGNGLPIVVVRPSIGTKEKFLVTYDFKCGNIPCHAGAVEMSYFKSDCVLVHLATLHPGVSAILALKIFNFP